MREKTKCCGFAWCVGDPCGIICAAITWLLVLYGEVCVLSVMMWSWEEYRMHQTFHFFLFQILAVLALASHLKTMLTDPGAVPKGMLTDDTLERIQAMTTEVIYKCQKCCSLKPERAHHCSVCERCIRRMDHHCPWVNNCVGEGNQKYFVLFTMYIALLSLHALYWGVWQFILCVGEEWRNCSAFGPPGTTLMLIFLLFEAILFSIFTCVMFGTQISSIYSDETAVESLKKERGDGRGEERRDGWKNVQQVMGGPFSIQWLNPLSTSSYSRRSHEYSV